MREYYKTLSGFGGTGNDPSVSGYPAAMYAPTVPDEPAYASLPYSGFGGAGNDPSVGTMGGFSIGDKFEGGLNNLLDMNWIGTQKNPGLIPTGVGVGKDFLTALAGFNQLAQAKRDSEESRRRYNQNFAIQSKLLNEQLSNRATGRASARGFANNSTESNKMVADHLAKYGVA